MDEYLDPKATVHIEVLSINRNMVEDQYMKKKKEEDFSQFGVPSFSLEIEKVISINAMAGTKRLPERLVFDM